MTDNLIARLSAADAMNLTAVMEGIRRDASESRDRFPTRTKALRRALEIAAAHYAGATGDKGHRAHG